jgi:hypothetical protein
MSPVLCFYLWHWRNPGHWRILKRPYESSSERFGDQARRSEWKPRVIEIDRLAGMAKVTRQGKLRCADSTTLHGLFASKQINESSGDFSAVWYALVVIRRVDEWLTDWICAQLCAHPFLSLCILLVILCVLG